MSALVWIAAPLIGLFLGMFGAGGGMLTVPLLVYGAGMGLKQAIAMSLWIVAAVSLIAAIHQRVWRLVRPKLLMFFIFGGMIGGVLGAKIGLHLPVALQQTLFGLLVLLVAGWTYRIRLSQQMERKPCQCPLVFAAGLGLGMVTGLFGVGGGFLMVPVLIALGISHLPTAVGHSLILIVINAAVSGAVYSTTLEMDYKLLLSIALIAGIGSILGGMLLRRVPVQRLQKVFSLFLALIGIGMLLDVWVAR